MELSALSTYTVLTIGGFSYRDPRAHGFCIRRPDRDPCQFGRKTRSGRPAPGISNPQPLILAGGVLIALAAFPGLPNIPFLILGSGVGFASFRLRQKAAAAPSTAAPTQAKENLESLMRVEHLAVEVGLGLVMMVEGGQNSLLSAALPRSGARWPQTSSDGSTGSWNR